MAAMTLRSRAGLLLLGLALASHAQEAAPKFERTKTEAKLEAAALKEASGMATSAVNDGLLWLLNDSGSPPELFLTVSNGEKLGKVTVDGVRNTDWEDLASFTLDGKPYLLIADTGDNGSQRKECALHIVAEPAAPKEGTLLARKASVAWTIRFRYEDGPRDCEAVSVDVKAKRVLLLSKRTDPPMLYELPLKPSKGGLQTAKKIGQLGAALPNNFPPTPFGTQPTGMSIAPDGTMAAIVTYAGAFLFPRRGDESWAASFTREPVRLPGHGLRQAECIAFSRDGRAIRVSSEGAEAPIILYQRQ
jgi:hypothetical protein